jgi:hypothetical protein
MKRLRAACEVEECNKIATTGAPGRGKTHCAKHKDEASAGGVGAVSRFQCHQCPKQGRRYQRSDGGTFMSCAAHAGGAVRTQGLCKACPVIAAYGFWGGSREACAEHQEAGMVNLNHPECRNACGAKAYRGDAQLEGDLEGLCLACAVKTGGLPASMSGAMVLLCKVLRSMHLAGLIADFTLEEYLRSVSLPVPSTRGRTTVNLRADATVTISRDDGRLARLTVEADGGQHFSPGGSWGQVDPDGEFVDGVLYDLAKDQHLVRKEKCSILRIPITKSTRWSVDSLRAALVPIVDAIHQGCAPTIFCLRPDLYDQQRERFLSLSDRFRVSMTPEAVAKHQGKVSPSEWPDLPTDTGPIGGYMSKGPAALTAARRR